MSGVRASSVLASLICLIGSVLPAVGAEPSAPPRSDSVTPMMQQMVGNWSVQAKMWPAAKAQAIELPPAKARREIIGGAFLQEVMEAVPSDPHPFTRIAYFGFNAMNRQYEYFSLDTRLPQMMAYTVPGANKMRAGTVELTGSSFVAPMWGERKNVPFIYRLAVRPVEGDRQIVQLFLAEQGGAQAEEFLAFEYIYSR